MAFPSLVIAVWSIWGVLLVGLLWVLYLILTERSHDPHDARRIALVVWVVIAVLYGGLGVYIYFQAAGAQPEPLTNVAKVLGGFLFLLVFGPLFDRVRKWWYTRGI
jgi:hypothetical protein